MISASEIATKKINDVIQSLLFLLKIPIKNVSKKIIGIPINIIDTNVFMISKIYVFINY